MRFFTFTLSCFILLETWAADKPNIILLMADDQGWGQTSYNKHPSLKTPHLDQMAKSGLRLNRFYAGGPVCSPTRASVLTARTPARTGVPDHGYNLCLQEKTLPQALKQAGYRTGLFGKWHLNGVRGHGVPILKDDANHPGHYGFDVWLSVTNFFDMNPLMSRNGKFEEFKGDSSEVIVDQALKFIKENKTKPFFAVIWYGSPHSPWDAFAKDRQGEGSLANLLGELVALDRSVGTLRKGLRDLGIEKNTIVWYCSDNGGLKNDPDSCGILKGFKGSFNEGGIRVPCIIEWPSKIKPAVSDMPSVSMDIMPTLLEIVGIAEDNMLKVRDGISIKGLLNGLDQKRQKQIPFYDNKDGALIDGDWKLINQGGKFSLFNLKSDPSESKDLSMEHSELLQKLKLDYEKTVLSIKESAKGKDYPEGKIIQKVRREFWTSMEVYEPHFKRLFKRPEYKKWEKRVPKNLKK